MNQYYQNKDTKNATSYKNSRNTDGNTDEALIPGATAAL